MSPPLGVDQLAYGAHYSLLVSKHWKPRSHNCLMDNKLKLSKASRSTFEIEWLFDIDTSLNLLTFLFELSPNVIISWSYTSLFSEVNIQGSLVICCVQPLLIAQWLPLVLQFTYTKERSSMFRHPNLMGA